MGPLTLPRSGIVYLDTQAIIYSIEAHSRYWAALEPLWRAARVNSGLQITTSELALLEVLVGPLRQNDQSLIKAYDELFASADLHSLRITTRILREAAQLRATNRSLRTPDAIHAATARIAGCSMFVTNDLRFRQLAGLPVVMLDDVVGP